MLVSNDVPWDFSNNGGKTLSKMCGLLNNLFQSTGLGEKERNEVAKKYGVFHLSPEKRLGSGRGNNFRYHKAS